jgi:peptidoglycan/LPS O-acetylase OafA/YrhL
MSGPASAPLAGTVAEKRIAALDGWRGVSILMVIFGHLVDQRYGSESPRIMHELADSISTLGVCIFFVISGLIITKLALRERDSEGSFSARNFYIRRVLRIVPPFYAYLLFLLALTALGAIRQYSVQTLESAAFSCNLPDSNCGWFGGHAWSLAYEEQFYLIFPMVFLALGRDLRIAAALLFAAFVCVPLVRFALHLGPPWYAVMHGTFYLSFICAGALMACWRDVVARVCGSWYGGYGAVAAVLTLCGLVAVEIFHNFHPSIGRYDALHRLLPPVLEPLCIAWLLGWSLHARGSVVRLLETGPIQFLGIISYSLYLWQQLFTAPLVDYGNVGWLLFCPLMIAFAILSYYLIERPCARFAKRLGHVGAHQRTDVAALDAQPRVRSVG